VLFHVLTRFGYAELAFKMIVRDDFPSYGNWLKRGATTLWEDFYPDRVSSMNHHFWGDISAWFIKRVAGIVLNPTCHDVNEVLVQPHFLSELEHASAHHDAPAGRINVAWERCGDEILLHVTAPAGMYGTIRMAEGYRFKADGSTEQPLASGTYTIVK
jgi:alpha-L-rhamnosidase